jgi:hypothetical protein
MIRRRLPATALLAALSSAMLISGCASFERLPPTRPDEAATSRPEDALARPPSATAPPGFHVGPWVSTPRSANRSSPLVGLSATF